MKSLLIAVALAAGVGCAGSATSDPKDPEGKEPTPAGPGAGATTSPNESSGMPTSSGTCGSPSGSYTDERSTVAVVEPPGPDSPCQAGHYIDRGATADTLFGGAPLPGCTRVRDESSPDQCTRTLEIACAESTCTQVITFSRDLKGYTGTITCNGQFHGVDEDGPFTCKTTVTGTKNP